MVPRGPNFRDLNALIKIAVVAGARPNFMKVAPLLAQLDRFPAEFAAILVHTGQHYDYEMSQIFFDELELSEPDCYLRATNSSQIAQMAEIMTRFDEVLADKRPDLVIVVGDVTSTVACALTASKREIPVAHVEAGLRSGDRRMPEELHRITTDALSDLLFTYSADADRNLQDENVPGECVFRVGNLMIDTLEKFRGKAGQSDILERLGAQAGGYALATLHRPSNVDDAGLFRGILKAFAKIQERLPILFQIHPRARKGIAEFGLGSLLAQMSQLQTIEPQGYLDMIKLQQEARLVMTDSGGMQEETTVLGTPCLTLRENTERPITIEQGTNELVGTETNNIVAAANRVLDGNGENRGVPELWDGKSAARLVEVLRRGIQRR
jgi:UDP-N-acetylglucosamine 2-epimerase (non-hydrolysing)